jgi:DNA primase catalytic core
MIPQQVIDNILSKTDIVEIISSYIQISKVGKDYRGKCPFHEDKNPSFSVSSEKQLFYCFGCREGGNAINFLEKYKNYTFTQALTELASHYSIDIVDSDSSDIEKKKYKKQLEHLQLFQIVGKYYHNNLFLPENALALEFALSRYTINQINLYKIGYSSENDANLVGYLTTHHDYTHDLLLESNLIFRNDDGSYGEVLSNKLIYPTCNTAGQITSFGANSLSDVQKPETIYLSNSYLDPKQDSLYLLNHARRSIKEISSLTLAQGYKEAITLQEVGITNTVAPCGGSLSEQQIDQINRIAESVTIIYDGDHDGKELTEKNALRLISKGLPVKFATVPDNATVAKYFKSQIDFNSLNRNIQDFLVFKARSFSKNINTPSDKREAIKNLSNYILRFQDKSLRNTYVEAFSKILKAPQKYFVNELSALEKSLKKSSLNLEGLPEGIDISSYEKYGFYEYNNEYYIRDNSGGSKRISNFIMKPIFHIRSGGEPKRIFELINFRGHQIVVDFDMKEMTSINNFKKNIEGHGNFLYWGNEQHMFKLKAKLYEHTRTCQEIVNLGWQKEGFFAWANGIINTDGDFLAGDEYGIVEHNYNNYFIPAFSKIFIDYNNVYLDERKFIHLDKDIQMYQWSELFIKVFGSNAQLGIAFWIATVFRDFILSKFSNFPILNLFGPKGTGKSQMAMSLCCLFGIQQTPFNIHNGTKPGLAEHIQLFKNAFAWIDEYKNNIEYDKIETLKSIYDAIGRNRLNYDKGKKETTQVNSGVILSGQEMPTADVALFSRMVFLQFHRDEYSLEEKRNYENLKNIEKSGLSHLTSSLIMHRTYFEKNFYKTYLTVLEEISPMLKGENNEDRIVKSFCTILAAYKTISNRLSISMKYEELQDLAISAIDDQIAQISRSNEITMFWETIEALYDENVLINRWHFKVDTCSHLSLKSKKIEFNTEINVLKLKFSPVYKIYATHHKKAGLSYLPKSTLQYYLTHNQAYIGQEKSSKFKLFEYSKEHGKVNEHVQVTSAFCFNYDMLNVNMIRTSSEDGEDEELGLN